MSIYQPYTYLIGWSNHNKWYYGVRYAQNCNPQDLWKTYFTSSKHVKKFREEYGEPDVVQVRKIFNTKKSAILWEEKVLQKLNVRNNDNWLNKNDCSAPPTYSGEEHPNFDNKWTSEQKIIQSEKLKGKLKGLVRTEEDRKNKSIAAKERWSRPGEKEKLSQKMIGNDYGKNKKGWTPTIETKERMRKAKIGKKQRRCCCVVCRQEVSVSNIVQHYNTHYKRKEGN
jgi:hypothetical protein